MFKFARPAKISVSDVEVLYRANCRGNLRFLLMTLFGRLLCIYIAVDLLAVPVFKYLIFPLKQYLRVSGARAVDAAARQMYTADDAIAASKLLSFFVYPRDTFGLVIAVIVGLAAIYAAIRYIHFKAYFEAAKLAKKDTRGFWAFEDDCFRTVTTEESASFSYEAITRFESVTSDGNPCYLLFLKPMRQYVLIRADGLITEDSDSDFESFLEAKTGLSCLRR